MKAVQELVAYFDRRGALSPRQLRKLLDQGFLAADAPQTMVDLCDPVGATFYFRVRGAIEGMLWGTDIYTGDSSLAVAAVHAGLVKGRRERDRQSDGRDAAAEVSGLGAQRRRQPRLRPLRHGLPALRDLTVASACCRLSPC